jgi:hypothetical protein
MKRLVTVVADAVATLRAGELFLNCNAYAAYAVLQSRAASLFEGDIQSSSAASRLTHRCDCNYVCIRIRTHSRDQMQEVNLHSGDALSREVEVRRRNSTSSNSSSSKITSSNTLAPYAATPSCR